MQRHQIIRNIKSGRLCFLCASPKILYEHQLGRLFLCCYWFIKADHWPQPHLPSYWLSRGCKHHGRKPASLQACERFVLFKMPNCGDPEDFAINFIGNARSPLFRGPFQKQLEEQSNSELLRTARLGHISMTLISSDQGPFSKRFQFLRKGIFELHEWRKRHTVKVGWAARL